MAPVGGLMMRIRLAQVHPAAKRRLQGCFAPTAAEQAEQGSSRLGCTLRVLLRRLGPVALGVAAGVLYYVSPWGADLVGDDPALGAGIGICVSLTGLATCWIADRLMARWDVLDPKLLLRRLRGIPVAPVIREYCEALGALAVPGLPIPPTEGRLILDEMNALLTRVLRHREEREELARRAGGKKLARLEADRYSIEARLATTADRVARQALEEGLALCQQRVESVGSLRLALERLDAEEIVVVQSLAALADGLRRIGRSREDPSTADLTQLRAALGRVTAYASSVESAVEEVLSAGAAT
jgi:hypothetical protein